jgi:spore maturation protein CgeB
MFEGAREMVDKVGYYLDHPAERETTAEAGHLRCLNSGHSVDDRARTMLVKVEQLRAGVTDPPYLAKAVNAP